MGHLRLCKILSVILVATVAYGGSPVAAASLNVLIAGEAGDLDAAPRHGRLHRAVVDELSALLQDQGFAVYDEAVVAPGGLAAGRMRRGDAQLIDAARTLGGPPVDVAIIFSVHVRTEVLSYTKKISSQISARMFSVMTGRHLGNLQVSSPKALRTPMDCEDGCLEAVFERDTRRLSQELGRRLVSRLASSLDTRPGDGGGSEAQYGGLAAAYTLVFEDFSAAEVFEIEEYLVVFSGYRRHRPISTGHGRHEYWYETASARGRLNRNLNKMLDYLDMPGQVDLSGNVFTVTKIAAAGETARSWDDW